jgi:hypothetical protein
MILDCFDSRPPIKSFLAHISSKTTFLDSTKWDIRAEHGPRIDSHLTRLDGFGDSVGSADVVGEDGGTQAMKGVVGFGDDFFLGGEFGNALFPKIGLVGQISLHRGWDVHSPRRGRRSPRA